MCKYVNCLLVLILYWYHKFHYEEDTRFKIKNASLNTFYNSIFGEFISAQDEILNLLIATHLGILYKGYQTDHKARRIKASIETFGHFQITGRQLRLSSPVAVRTVECYTNPSKKCSGVLGCRLHTSGLRKQLRLFSDQIPGKATLSKRSRFILSALVASTSSSKKLGGHIFKRRYAYQSGKSIVVAIHHLVSSLEVVLLKRHSALEVFLDIVAAFDTSNKSTKCWSGVEY